MKNFATKHSEDAKSAQRATKTHDEGNRSRSASVVTVRRFVRVFEAHATPMRPEMMIS